MTRKFLVPIVLPADPTAAMEAATKQYVDANAGGGGGIPALPYKAGLWYGNYASSISSTAVTAGTLRLAPWEFPDGVKIGALGVNVSAGGVAMTLRAGIYDEVDGLPKNLMVGSDALDGATSGFKQYNLPTPLQLPPGRYWVGCVPQSAAVSISISSSAFGYRGLGNSNGALVTTNSFGGYGWNSAYGTNAPLPSVLPAPTDIASTIARVTILAAA